MLMEQQTVTNTAWPVCHDIKSAMHPLLAQARPRMINHLTSIKLILILDLPCTDIHTQEFIQRKKSGVPPSQPGSLVSFPQIIE